MMQNQIEYNFNNTYNKQIFKHSFYYIFSLVVFLFVSCSKDTNPETIVQITEGTEISNFSFLQSDNPSLNANINLVINNNIITGKVPFGGDITNLVATFEHNGSEVFIDNINQFSGSTDNDFSKVVTYTVGTSDNQEQSYDVKVSYFTGLPIFNIDTNGAPIDSKEDYREGFVSTFGGLNFDDLQNTEMKIRGRGNSTWYVHPKKPYQLKFNDENEALGMPEEKKWIFLAEHSDKTLMRNKIAFEMGYISNLDWTPQSHYAEVFVNNEYNGTYNISEKVEASPNRVALGDTGYLLEIDQLERLDEDDVYFYTGSFLINIKEPELVLNSSEYNYAKNLLNDFEANLMSNQFTNPTTGYTSYIDSASFIDWYLISEITKNQDSRNFSSIFLNVIPGGKIKMGPLWDFDLAFGNVDYSECEYPSGFWVKDNAWFNRLFEDPEFVNQVKTRFTYFRENQNFILDKMDYYADYLNLAQQENNDKWNVIGNYTWPNPVVYNTYEEEVEHLKNWYIQRMDWLNTALNEL